MAALRERIKQCELDMERMQTTALYGLVGTGGPTTTVATATQREMACNNLNVYFTATGVNLDPLGHTHVKQILDAVFA